MLFEYLLYFKFVCFYIVFLAALRPGSAQCLTETFQDAVWLQKVPTLLPAHHSEVEPGYDFSKLVFGKNM